MILPVPLTNQCPILHVRIHWLVVGCITGEGERKKFGLGKERRVGMNFRTQRRTTSFQLIQLSLVLGIGFRTTRKGAGTMKSFAPNFHVQNFTLRRDDAKKIPLSPVYESEGYGSQFWVNSKKSTENKILVFKG